MSLVEIARFQDVYEADLAAAFLESHGIRVFVTERHQTTIDPLMQRALGIRIMGAESSLEEARALLSRAQAGEFAEPDGDDIGGTPATTRAATTLMALVAFATGGFWGTSLPRRLRAPSWQGMLLSALIFFAAFVVLIVRKLILDPP
ncbi:putative signal transducing protein [Brevundimonas staleyi]|uniref:Signal transducing protein n=1 Tax=Brevundimonas staleyi TaxID=74326 RepID=A0ABW0FXF0_9CAUL